MHFSDHRNSTSHMAVCSKVNKYPASGPVGLSAAENMMAKDGQMQWMEETNLKHIQLFCTEFFLIKTVD